MAINDRAIVRHYPELFSKREAPKTPEDTRTPQEKFAAACKRVFVPVPENMGYKPMKEKAYGNDIKLAKEAIGEMAAAGASREEFIQTLLAYPLESRWDILEHNLLPAWNEATPQASVSIEELKRVKGVVEEVRAEVSGRVFRHRGGHR